MLRGCIFLWSLMMGWALSAYEAMPYPNANALGTDWILVTGSDFPPYTDLDYPAGGLVVKLIEMVMAKMEGEYALKWLPWRRGYLETIDGKYIATFPYVHTSERAQHLHYSDAIIGVEERIFVRADDFRNFNRIEQFHKIIGCKPVGYNINAIQTFVDNGHIEILWADNLNTCFLLLRQGRVDLVDMDKYVGYAAIKKAGLSAEEFKMHERVLLTQTMHLLVSKKHPKAGTFLNAFNASLNQVKASKEYQALLKEYLQ